MDATPYIGRSIADRFRISRQIGEDALGLRFVARDIETRKQASILVLRPELVEPHAEALIEVGEQLKVLVHPSIVRVLHQQLDGYEYVRVTQWDPGGLLGSALTERPLMSSSVRWCHEIADALVAAHAAGLLHQGIAPHTIRLVKRSNPPDVPRLDDWGLTRILHAGGDPLTSTGLHYTGGAAWLSPEYIQGNPSDERSDLYALGAVLFQALTGRPPFHGPELKVLAAHVTDPVPAPSQHVNGIPHGLDELVLQLLAKDPADRPQTAAEVRGRLAEAGAQLLDGAAHPERVTANVAPTRLPNVSLQGTAAHAPRVDRISRPTPTPLPPAVPRGLVVAGLAVTAVGLCLVGVLAWLW